MTSAVLVKVLLAPMLIGAASLAARRWGHRLGGWLVALPLTSAPLAFLLAVDQGSDFARVAAVGMLAGTISQASFAVWYRASAARGRLVALATGAVAFAVSTGVLAVLQWPVVPMFCLVVATLVLVQAGLTPLSGNRSVASSQEPVHKEHLLAGVWPEIGLRMLVAAIIVVALSAAAPVIGARVAGLLSPFPVFGAVMAVFTHRSHGPAAGAAAVEGLLAGLFTPAVFFFTLAVALPGLGFWSFCAATAAALGTQAATMRAVKPRRLTRPHAPLAGGASR